MELMKEMIITLFWQTWQQCFIVIFVCYICMFESRVLFQIISNSTNFCSCKNKYCYIKYLNLYLYKSGNKMSTPWLKAIPKMSTGT